MKTKTIHLLTLIVLIVSLSIPTLPARAATTWSVRSTGDGVPVPANCPSLSCRLRDAIAAAAPGDTITFHLPVSSTITLTYGTLQIDKDLTIDGPGSIYLTLDANNLYGVISIWSGVTTHLSGLKLTHGSVTDTSGGGIINNGGIVYLDDMNITYNAALSTNGYIPGGGIFNGGTMTITNSTVTHNTAGHGAGIYSHTGTTLNMTNVSVDDNLATSSGGYGGGIYLSSGAGGHQSSMNLDNVMVRFNTADYGAGIYFDYLADVTINNGNIYGNIAGISGGGIMDFGAANAVVTNTLVAGNQAGQWGGGIYIESGEFAMTDSTISGNTAGTGAGNEGGGILLSTNGFNSHLTLNRATVSNNHADGNGGGLSLYGTASLTNVTIAENSSGVRGGGLGAYDQATVNLSNVTIAGNSANDFAGGIQSHQSATINMKNTIIADGVGNLPDCSANINSEGYNLIENFDPLNCIVSGDTGTNITGSDPMLGPLVTAPGAITQTMGLMAGSPAIDSADNSTCSDEDQNQLSRPQDGDGNLIAICDMGAVEAQGGLVVQSITRLDPNPTSASTVDFRVSFTEDVSGVDLTDFDLTTTGDVANTSIVNVSGAGDEYVVTVDTGSGTGTIRLDVLDDDSILTTANGDPLGGSGAGNGDATFGEIYNISASLTIQSSAALDGWILESSEKSGKGGTKNNNQTTIKIGDDAANKQYRGLLSFDTSALPADAQIISVILMVKRAGTTSGLNPIISLQGFKVDVKKGNFKTPSLELGDFKAAATQTLGTFNPALTSGWYSMDLSSGGSNINLLGNTQIRLRFTLDDNNNNAANYLSIYSGNSASAKVPQLIITYTSP